MQTLKKTAHLINVFFLLYLFFSSNLLFGQIHRKASFTFENLKVDKCTMKQGNQNRLLHISFTTNNPQAISMLTFFIISKTNTNAEQSISLSYIVLKTNDVCLDNCCLYYLKDKNNELQKLGRLNTKSFSFFVTLPSETIEDGKLEYRLQLIDLRGDYSDWLYGEFELNLCK
jgi:hypothetical protein